jgi:ketosteroid isomerase-like protein
MTDLAERLLTAYAINDRQALAALYRADARQYGPLHWPRRGREEILAGIAETHRRFPAFRLDLHDVFTSTDGDRVVLRWVQHWPADGSGAEVGTSSEMRVLTVREGRIAQEILGYVTLEVPRLAVTGWREDGPVDTPDPNPAVVSARIGEPSPPPPETIAQRWVTSFGSRDVAAFVDLYHDDFAFYSPAGWGVRGKDVLPQFADAFHEAFPGLRVSLTDEFASADGTRVSFRFVIDWHNTGAFFGQPATGRRGTHVEQHTMKLRDGGVVEQVVSDVSLGIPRLQFTVWDVELPTDTPDPAPVIGSAGPVGR